MRSELFIGNLHRDTIQRDIEDVFDKYGKIIKLGLLFVINICKNEDNKECDIL